MAKKGKAKISKAKRNNQTTNKMKKLGKLRLQRHREKPQKQRQPTQPQVEYSSDSDSAKGDEWADMLDEEEQKYIMNRLAKQPHLLNNVPEKDQQETKPLKRKRIMAVRTDSDVEDTYLKELADRPIKKFRPLLPIKTKQGLVERLEECNDTESEIHENQIEAAQNDAQDSQTDSEMDEPVPKAFDGEIINTVQLVAARRDQLNNNKLRIGALCSSLLESPEKKLKNLYPILYLMEERLKDGAINLQSIRKLATLSAYEVFRDILPEYHIRHQDYSNVKLKKDTLALYKYEKELLEFYKRYLQRLEKACAVLRPKKGDNRKPDDATVSLGVVSLRCMCGLLVARPYFNYATNIAQSVVPFLACANSSANAAVTQCCSQVFSDDKRGEITLAIVRLINQLVKRRGDRLQPSALDCLLTLKIRDVDLDAEADLKHKKKQEEKHKKRIVNLSKKERKRAKKLKEVERELLETEAQESEVARRQQLTEVTKTVFHIYFRLLKTSPRSKLLIAALNGLAKFTHVINLEYYTDLVSILSRLLDDDEVGRRERLVCARTALAVLTGAGDALNVDPAGFHRYLYANALGTHAGNTQEDAKIILEAVSQICARARRVSPAVLQAFAKRLATLATQLPHNGALACLALLHSLANQSKSVSSLFEPDTEATGSGRFDPSLESPEHCGAHAATLHEMCTLRRHYHPTVREVAANLLQETRSMPQELAKLSPTQILTTYDGSMMAFKPAVPPPKQQTMNKQNKATHMHVWTQNSFKQMCENIENSVKIDSIT